MAIENKKMILLEDIKGNREIAYALLEASHPLFSNYKITIVDESLLLENEIELGDYDWNKFKDLTIEEKLRNLISIGLLYDELKNSKYTYELTPYNLIFTINGKPIDRKRPQRRMISLCKILKIEYRSFHSIRHSYATRLFELDIPIKTVQSLMGHSDMSTTMDIYTHVMKDKKLEILDKLDNL